jgi:hypothetical protein
VDAAEVRDKLRKRHPATQKMGARDVPGPWTCIEEWRGVDLLALSATKGGGKAPYARVGYEVKVSRADYRSELKQPSKRADAVAFCHEFYFAVPADLLASDEIAGLATGPSALYVPEDVGLVTISKKGCRVVKAAPVNREPAPLTKEQPDGNSPFGASLNALVRWVSARPDPRHEGVVEEARRRGREIAEAQRKRDAEFEKACRDRERLEREELTGDFHVGRTWKGHEVEDGCPCPKEPCGLVSLAKVDPDCPQHSIAAGKTMRQSHPASSCSESQAEVSA